MKTNIEKEQLDKHKIAEDEDLYEISERLMEENNEAYNELAN